MNNPLAGLVAVVTGGASGIGHAITSRLRSAGASVAVLDLNPSPFADVFFQTVDIVNSEAVDKAVAAVAEKYGRIDIVVNNVGLGAQGTIEANPDDEWHRVFDVNVMSIVRVSRAALPWLRKSPSASIVNIGSIAATQGLPERALYSSTKGAVTTLTLAMAADHLREGIRVNVVNPGTADTPWVQRLLAAAADPDAERIALENRQPHGRLVTAEEVAGAVMYLASPDSGSTTGACIAVDGGMNSLRLRPIPAQ
jgi:NAD(P)-dependent dehydrogenase (short-subunit alcohol dehydrogenase family)